MKMLSLLRHAKSAWDAPVGRDFDRRLSPRGRKAARAMGREMRRLGLAFDLVLASPAARALETLTELAQGYGGAVATDQDERLYLASADSLLEIVRATDDSVGRLLVVGHNPGIEQLALLLAQGGAARDRMAAKYPTGALAHISFSVPCWRALAPDEGRLDPFIRPRDLAAGLGPDD